MSNPYSHRQFFLYQEYICVHKISLLRGPWTGRMRLLFCYSCVSPAFRGKEKKVILCFGNLNLSVESEFLPAKGIWIFLRFYWSSKQIRALSGAANHRNATLIQFARMLVASKFPLKANWASQACPVRSKLFCNEGETQRNAGKRLDFLSWLLLHLPSKLQSNKLYCSCRAREPKTTK